MSSWNTLSNETSERKVNTKLLYWFTLVIFDVATYFHFGQRSIFEYFQMPFRWFNLVFKFCFAVIDYSVRFAHWKAKCRVNEKFNKNVDRVSWLLLCSFTQQFSRKLANVYRDIRFVSKKEHQLERKGNNRHRQANFFL